GIAGGAGSCRRGRHRYVSRRPCRVGDVEILRQQHGERGRVNFFVLAIQLDGLVNLFQVGSATRLRTTFLGAAKSREQNRREQADNGQNNQKFDQRER